MDITDIHFGGSRRKEIAIFFFVVKTVQEAKGELMLINVADQIAIPVRDILGRLKKIHIHKPDASEYKNISWTQLTVKNTMFVARLMLEPSIHFNDIDIHDLLCEWELEAIYAASHCFSSITQTSKVKKWPKEQLLFFKEKDVVYSNADEADVKYTSWVCHALSMAVKSVRTIQWPSHMDVSPGSELPKDHGQDEKLLREVQKDTGRFQDHDQCCGADAGGNFVPRFSCRRRPFRYCPFFRVRHQQTLFLPRIKDHNKAVFGRILLIQFKWYQCRRTIKRSRSFKCLKRKCLFRHAPRAPLKDIKSTVYRNLSMAGPSQVFKVIRVAEPQNLAPGEIAFSWKNENQ